MNQPHEPTQLKYNVNMFQCFFKEKVVNNVVDIEQQEKEKEAERARLRDEEKRLSEMVNNKWKTKLRTELKYTSGHFVEIKARNAYVRYSDNNFDNNFNMSISVRELTKIINELSIEMQCDYFITTRSIDDSSAYYMVWTIIHKKQQPHTPL